MEETRMEVVGYYKTIEGNERYIVLTDSDTIVLKYSEKLGKDDETLKDIRAGVISRPKNWSECYYNRWLRQKFGEYADIYDCLNGVSIKKVYSRDAFDILLYNKATQMYLGKRGLLTMISSIKDFLVKYPVEIFKEASYTVYRKALSLDKERLERDYDLIKSGYCFSKGFSWVGLEDDEGLYIQKCYRFVRSYLMPYIEKNITKKKNTEGSDSPTIETWEDLNVSVYTGGVNMEYGLFSSCTVEYSLLALPEEDFITKRVYKWQNNYKLDALHRVYQKLGSSEKEQLNQTKPEWLYASMLYKPKTRSIFVSVHIKRELVEAVKKLEADLEDEEIARQINEKLEKALK